MVKRFLKSRRTGFYLAVTREGEVGAGDDLTLLSHDPDSKSHLRDLLEFSSSKTPLRWLSCRSRRMPSQWFLKAAAAHKIKFMTLRGQKLRYGHGLIYE